MKPKLLFLSLIISTSLNGGEVRTWTAADGRTLEAELISVDEKGVTVQRKTDGKRMDLTLEMLSEDDQNFVKNLVAAEAKEDRKSVV